MDLNNLGIKSINDMSVDEAIEMLRIVRASRNTSKVKPKAKVPNAPKASTLSQSEATNLLKILKGN